ncbi:MAG: CinA family protein [Spirochaetaceae bacterium]|jgi:PncC family amidohydrolase|nr:CinA family protein [Spirochaetaceae bacterium]
MRTAVKLFKKLKEKSLQIVFAESCTAGLVADALACVPGASSVLWGSYVTYTNDAKQTMLKIKPELLAEHGAVSSECACAMACSALKESGASIAVSVTGLAGPSGDGSNPVGTVWIGCASLDEKKTTQAFLFKGSRPAIRRKAVQAALQIAIENSN